ncbi:MAG: T9SS type A sorting domain-containing protein [Flavobacteriales bacterium]|nr:T9SS type A sorting domain-containing protein [Flavobacteriales bacterium]
MLRALLLFVLLVLHALLQAQLFGPQTYVNMSAPYPSVVDAADMDGDGHVDVITACRDGKVGWFQHDGMLNFSMLQLITLMDSTGTPQLVVADLDGDGDPDVLSASDHDNRIFLNMNLGGGAFGPQQVITDMADGVSCLAVTDVDGDGDTDLLSASVNDDKLAWYANDGSGNFGAQQVISATADHISHVTTADLDGDGDQDIIMVSRTPPPYSWTGDIVWLANSGSGSFDTAQTIASSLSRVGKASVGDIDGDGDKDIAYSGSAYFVTYINNGNGLFEMNYSHSLTDNLGDIVILHDLDNDGDLDGLVGGISWLVGIMENNGSGYFSQINEADNTVYLGTYSINDLNEDGLVDIVHSVWNRDRIRWFINSGDLEFVFTVENELLISDYNMPTNVQTFDMEQDGDLDLIYGSFYVDEHIRWQHNTGGGSFTTELNSLIHLNSYCYDNCNVFSTGDIDGDGDTDIIDGEGQLFLNDGSGNYTLNGIINGIFPSLEMELTDLDSDGDLDLRTGTRWRANDGTGVFGSELWNSQSGWLWRSISLDIDGDGDVDIAGIASGDSSIAWVENDGSGGFGAQQLITDLVSEAGRVAAADLDGDGDLDLVIASFNNGKVTWYANNGQGNFGPQQLITVLSGAWCIATGDLDGDGDVDVVAGDNTEGKIVWTANTGAGMFGPQDFINNRRWNAWDSNDYILGDRSVICADLDGDGDLDVATSAVQESKVAWHENRSNTIGISTVPANTLTLYPNPMTKSTTVVLDQAGGTVLVELLDVQGRVVRAQQQTVKDHQLTITREGLQRGQYLLRITGAERAEGKLMVE